MRPGTGATVYVLWAALAVGGSIALAGLTAESVTRLLVIGFFIGTSSARSWLVVPAVVGTYLVCGALIKVAGRWSGLEPR